MFTDFRAGQRIEQLPNSSTDPLLEQFVNSVSVMESASIIQDWSKSCGPSSLSANELRHLILATKPSNSKHPRAWDTRRCLRVVKREFDDGENHRVDGETKQSSVVAWVTRRCLRVVKREFGDGENHRVDGETRQLGVYCGKNPTPAQADFTYTYARPCLSRPTNRTTSRA